MNDKKNPILKNVFGSNSFTVEKSLKIFIFLIITKKTTPNKKKLDFFTASLGDLITLSLLSWIASLLFADIEEDRWLSSTIIATYLLFTPVCIYFAKKNASTIGKKYALKRYDQFALNTSCFWGSTGSNIIPVVQFHEKIMNKFHY